MIFERIVTKIKKRIPLSLKNIAKFFLNDLRNFIDYLKEPFLILEESRREKLWLSKEDIKIYRKNIKIYDVFLFFNELELLEIRLNILDQYVDYFVIVEATETFTGLPKQLYFEENKHLFKKWEHKIIHYAVRDTPKNEADIRNRLLNKNLSTTDKEILNFTLSTDNVPDKKQLQWLREFYQKETMQRVLTGLKDDDICFISDLDEIWNPEITIDYSRNDIFKLKQTAYIYHLNNRSNENWRGWVGTIATKYKNIKNNSINHIRTPNKNRFTMLRDGGWHFSFQGGSNMVKQKLESYSHQEINTKDIKLKIEATILGNKDIRGRHIKFWKDESELPKYILDNREKYSTLFMQ
ncbi:MAG: hypothetical protein WAV15_03015 [Minisyncoccia bacterium]